MKILRQHDAASFRREGRPRINLDVNHSSKSRLKTRLKRGQMPANVVLSDTQYKMSMKRWTTVGVARGERRKWTWMTGLVVSKPPWRGCHAVEFTIIDWRIQFASNFEWTQLKCSRANGVVDGSCALEFVRDFKRS